MKRAILATIASFFATIMITHSDTMVIVLNFLVAGVVPGTSIVVPFWAMMALYCLVITMVTTLYVESLIAPLRSQHYDSLHRDRLPKRRYSHI